MKNKIENLATINHMMKVRAKDNKVTYVHADIDPLNIRELKGLMNGIVKRAAGSPVEIAEIPARLLSFDTRYQIPERVNRSKAKLIANFDIRKMAPLIGVVHEEEGYVAILDGVGRLTATQTIDPDKYEELPVMILMDAPKDPDKRLVFEAEYYELQDENNAKVTPLQKHGARLISGDSRAILIEKMKDKYNINLADGSGKAKKEGYVNYTELFRAANMYAEKERVIDFMIDVMKESGMLIKPGGRSSYMCRCLLRINHWYGECDSQTREYLKDYLRPVDPKLFKVKAKYKYPELDIELACSLYLEDVLVENLGLQQKHMVNEKGKIIEIPVAV